jgi:hypothetical protein
LLLEERLPADPVLICPHIKACLETKHYSLSLASLLWRNLSERLLDGKLPEARTPEEQRVIRETLALLQWKTAEWRRQIFGAKLGGHLTVNSRFSISGSFGSKAGPRPKPYDVGLASDTAQERWGRVRPNEKVVNAFLKLHPFAMGYSLKVTLPEGTRGGSGGPRTRDFGVFDVLTVRSGQQTMIPVEVEWNADRQYCYWKGQVRLPANVELTYVDVLKYAKGRVRGTNTDLGKLLRAKISSRAGFFSYKPLNPLFLMDVRDRCGTKPKSIDAATERQVAGLVALLGDYDFHVRAEAQRKLLAMGAGIRDLLARQRHHEDLETRARVLAILKEIRSQVSWTEERRVMMTWLTDFWML